MKGKTLLHYRILSAVGSGGMGEVWEAEDTKLHRNVALKILPPDLSGDPERLARFRREATAVAALNHPNIVTIHSIEEAEGIHFITMEMVDGRPLSEEISKRGMKMARFFAVATQLADAVSAAHLQGITHRDLKPDNVMISGDGRVKVLDFGLAKLAEEPKTAESETGLPTKALKTEEGKVMGTVAYMSPEQAEGKLVDPRSDVFSLGVVLYEMATGLRPFRGDTQASIISSILRDSPQSITELTLEMPRHLSRIIKRCLAKDPLRRYQTALEVRNELEELRREIESGESLPASATAGPAGGGRSSRLWIGLFGAAVIALAATIGFLVTRPGGTPGPAAGGRTPGLVTRLTQVPGAEIFASLSPDGKTFAYASARSGNWDIYVQRVGGQNPVNLTESSPADDRQPAFSPDGERIVFRSERDGGGIFIMGATGESLKRLTDFGCHPAWSPDSRRVALTSECFSSPRGRLGTSSLWVVGLEGGEAKKVFDGDAVQSAWSPGGGRIAFWGVPRGSGRRDIWTIRTDGADPVQLTDDDFVDWNPVWDPDGTGIYFTSERGGAMNIWRLPVDEISGRATGSARQITAGVSASSHHMSLSADGTRLAYVSSTIESDLQRVPFDPAKGEVTGPPEWVARTSGISELCDPSPDGSRFVCQVGTGKREVIVVMDADGSNRREMTADDHKNRIPRWAPDGSRFAFYSDRSGSYELWTMRPDGSELTRITDTPGESSIYAVWAPDSSRLIYQELQARKATIISLDPQAEPRTTVIPHGKGGESLTFWDWSGNDVLIGAYPSAAGPLRGIGTYDLRSGEYRRLTEAGSYPTWSADGRRAFYVERQQDIILLDTKTGSRRTLLSVKPDIVGFEGVRVGPGDRQIFFTRSQEEADVWLLELD